MIRTALILAAGFFAFDNLLPQVSPAHGRPLSTLKWEKRPLLIFAPDAGQADRQWSILQQSSDGLKDRDMVVLTITDRVDVRHGPAPTDLSAAGLRAYYDVPQDRYESILIGKDGTRKALWRDPVEAVAIFRIVDAMPMRQREMIDD
ncbi:DUF4174 domain-containing protein [Notoacmeibacter marinus]|nr:DUF4174 domain-containing protein [Notoacmeibacter marinus]